MPYVTALADFREQVRKIALEENSRLHELDYSANKEHFKLRHSISTEATL